MIHLQKQAFRHRPADGIDGDCTRTCVAMLLGIPRDDVPHEHGVESPADYLSWKERIAREFGVFWITIALPAQDRWSLGDYAEFGLQRGQRQAFILGGASRNGTDHSVVIDEGPLILDPAIDDSGIVGPCKDGHYWYEWIARPLERAA